MAALVKFKPEDLEKFRLHYASDTLYEVSGDYWEVYLDASGVTTACGYYCIVIQSTSWGNAEIGLSSFNDNPAAVIEELRKIFTNFDEITLDNEATPSKDV